MRTVSVMGEPWGETGPEIVAATADDMLFVRTVDDRVILETGRCPALNHCTKKAGTSARILSTVAGVVQVTAMPDEEFTVLVDAEYNGSHGWGHWYRCRVRDVRAGTGPQQTLQISVYGTVDLYDGLLLGPGPQRNHALVIRFRQRPDLQYGPPPGFRDVTGMYWEILSVERDR